MRKRKWFRSVDIANLDDGTLLVNLYATQALTFFIGIIVVLFQRQKWNELFSPAHAGSAVLLGIALAVSVIAADMLVSRWVPEDVTDDGGVNDKLFRARPLWHILLISAVVSVCEELLFRGAVQHVFGAYWTSILFAAIHVRYLRHWLMTGLVFSISYALGTIYVWTGTLLAPIVAHFVIDAVMGCIIRFRKGEQDANE